MYMSGNFLITNMNHQSRNVLNLFLFSTNFSLDVLEKFVLSKTFVLELIKSYQQLNLLSIHKHVRRDLTRVRNS